MSQLSTFNGKTSKQEEPPEKKEPIENVYTLDEIEKQLHNSSIQHYFVRLSSEKKKELLTTMFMKMKNLHSLSVLLNVFFPVNTKLLSYSKVSQDTMLLYDEYLQDHSRMLNTVYLEQQIDKDLIWFDKLRPSQQIRTTIGLMRLAGGSIIKKVYCRLIKIFNERKSSQNKINLTKYNSIADLNFNKDAEKLLNLPSHKSMVTEAENDAHYKTGTPMFKKVAEGRKNWQAMMAKLNKDLETDVDKFNQPILQALKRTNSKLLNKETRGSESGIGSDWVQLLPIWTVKKIFSYLDETTLSSLKSVNTYWANISKEVLVEIKYRNILDEAIDNSMNVIDEFLKSDIPNIKDIKPEPKFPKVMTVNQMKREKLKKRGSVCKEIKAKNEKLHETSIFSNYVPTVIQDESFELSLLPFPTTISKVPSLSDIDYESEPHETSHMHMINNFKEIEERPSQDSLSDNEFDIKVNASTISIVPSIIVSQENLKTWLFLTDMGWDDSNDSYTFLGI